MKLKRYCMGAALLMAVTFPVFAQGMAPAHGAAQRAKDVHQQKAFGLPSDKMQLLEAKYREWTKAMRVREHLVAKDIHSEKTRMLERESHQQHHTR